MSTLTEQQQAFVTELVASGCTPTEAARRAGYTHPAQEAYRLIRKPNLIAAIRSERERLVEGELTGLALKTLREILIDAGAPAVVKLKAAVIVLKTSGMLSTGGAPPSDRDGSLQEMTGAELRALAARLRSDTSGSLPTLTRAPE